MLTGFHPYIVTPWGTDILIDAKVSRWNRLITTLALRRADLITTDGYHVKEEMMRLGVREEKIRLVFFGTDVKRFSPQTEEAEDVGLRKEYELSDSVIVISTRTLTPIHDVGTLIRAIPYVKQAVPGVIFVIVGDGPERKSLEELARALGVWDFVRFIGRVEEAEMVKWLRAADVYVSTSLADAGLAASTAEAMACGLPVVVTDNADNRKWVTEGAGGYLVPNGRFDLLADRIVQLLKDKKKRLDFGRINRRVIEERNNYVTEMNKMEAIYEELARRVR
jgi:glycosyltransferase involved in cell wall biosynthesis